MYRILRYKVPAICFSSVFILIGVIFYFLNSGFKYSVDFTGGTELRIKFDSYENFEAIKEVIINEWQGKIYNIVGSNEIIVRIQKITEDVENLNSNILKSINKVSINNPGKILQTNSVSNTIGNELRTQFIKAILIALLAMLIYIGIRFKFNFALGAIIALAHDALTILTFFLLFKQEITIDVIGAILAVLGYSINDTIVIFSRINQNLNNNKNKNESLETIVNKSLNETLSRTILTSFATILVVISLFIFGGISIRPLALTLFLGILFGTYSSIFIASPIMMFFTSKKK